ncbi:hypothetical protein B0H14DRAFT_3604613 [Mycena olivaceomarginata]|nr:hypothetical protein B0H14DRAFT_3604613 [Mycena olivaceomarginata]
MSHIFTASELWLLCINYGGAANNRSSVPSIGTDIGLLSIRAFTPFAAPNLKRVVQAAAPSSHAPRLKTRLTSGSLPPPRDLGLQNKATPWQMSARTTSRKAIIPCADAHVLRVRIPPTR